MKLNIKMILYPIGALIVIAALVIIFTRNKEAATVTPEVAKVNNLYREGNYKKGPDSAKVIVLEFFDPECEGCAAFHPIAKSVLAEYKDRVQFIARYMLYHGNSHQAALALEGAGKQGKYWEMFDFMLERQKEWSHQNEPVNSVFEKFAKELGLNIEEFNKSYDDVVFNASLAKDKNDGVELGVHGTPTFFINGKMLENLSQDDLKKAIDEALAANP